MRDLTAEERERVTLLVEGVVRLARDGAITLNAAERRYIEASRADEEERRAEYRAAWSVLIAEASGPVESLVRENGDLAAKLKEREDVLDFAWQRGDKAEAALARLREAAIRAVTDWATKGTDEREAMNALYREAQVVEGAARALAEEGK